MIEISVKAGAAAKQRDDAIVLPLLAERKLTDSGLKLKEASEQALTSYLRKFDHMGEFGEIGVLYELPGTLSARTVMIGAGEERKLTLNALRRLAAKAARALQKSGARDISLYLAELSVRGASEEQKVQAIAEGIWLGLYTFDRYKSEKKENKRALRSATIMIGSRSDLTSCEAAVARARASGSGTNFARDLANEPGNVCTPAWLGEQALALAGGKLSVTVMDKAAIAAAGFRGLLAVNQGSVQEPRFIVLKWQGGEADSAPVALVGKGLTFDAGGISLKPPAAMDEMKFDMCGAAAVLGTFKAAAELDLPLNLLGVIPATENLPGGSAYKPGDVLTSYQGITIEVLNTDAEGRIILADALAWAAEQKPAEIVDFATLTGACVVALGSQASGLLGNNDDLIEALKVAGDASGDRVWQLPLYEEYQEQIKSEIADIKNIGGKEAGTITGACFLSRFVGETPWAHLDIAGTAWDMKGSDLAAKGATGAGVRLTLDYLLSRNS